MFKYYSKKSLFCLGLVIMLTVPAWGIDSLIVNISETAFIVNPVDQNDVRILLDIDGINSLDTNSVVMVAQLRSEVSVTNAPNRSILVHAYPLSTDWSANNVSWSSPWTNAGGDVVEDLSVLGRISTGDDQNIKLDVTRIIQRIVSGNLENHGLILSQIGDEKRPVVIQHSNPPNGGDPLVELAVYYINRN